ncbi:DegT/DnrJ/EryC1/StrS family aminotransferase [candidate division KSB1 bacterium]|nr:DegT/DnrJ/EryC1/StrS family aminotransferase [candidate division KSB1 bacterium]
MFGLMPVENWEYNLHDMFDSFSALLKHERQNGTIIIKQVGNCIPVRSGRAAIVAAIKALGLMPGAHIAVPLYSCPAVFKAIEAVDCKPVFIDIERDTCCISASDLSGKIHQVDAVIAIHMFGNLCDMHRLLEVAQGKPIIEDCAQSLGSKYIGSKYKGEMSGTVGTVGVFSFRSGKYLSVGEGGAIYTKDPKINLRLRMIISEMNTPSKKEEIIHIIKTYLRTKLRSRPWFGFAGKNIWKIYNRTVSYTSKTPIKLSKIMYPDFKLTCKRLVDFDKIVARHRSNAEYFTRNLHLHHGMLCSEQPHTFYNRYAYPVFFTSIEQRDTLADNLLKKNIDTIKPYQNSAELAAEHYGYEGDCPTAEKVSKTILLMPVHSRLKQHELFYITRCFNECWNAKFVANFNEQKYSIHNLHNV